jgi:nucleoside-diphosphate-sugar epimerase
MKIIVIGGTGHIGTYLVPRLVRDSHEVVVVTRGNREPYASAPEWESVERAIVDRRAEDEAGAFGRRIASLQPDAVIDLICFNADSARQIVTALPGTCRHYLSCGTIWVHGPAERVPTPESAPRRPVGDYGIDKNMMEAYLLDPARGGPPATVIHPGHIVGEGWPPLNPQGNFDLAVWKTIRRGGELPLPNLGLECVHHVHADDVAQQFVRALDRPSVAAGAAFHAVSPQAVTLRGYAEAAYAWFGNEPQLKFMPLAELKARIDAGNYEQTFEHVRRSPCMSIKKARSLLGYQPRYSSLSAAREAVDWLIAHGGLDD